MTDPISDRHYLNNHDMLIVEQLVAKHGLRPMVDAVGAVAKKLVEDGQKVKDAYGDPMDKEDVETASHHLTHADLY